MHHGGAAAALQAAGLPHRAQELEEGVRAAGHAEVRPGGVVEVEDVTRLITVRVC